MRVTWLGHATCVLDLPDGTRLVTDPLLGARAGVLIRRGRVPEHAEWVDADAVLLSHLHHDHAHLPSLRATGGLVLGPASTARWAERQRLRARGLGDEWFQLSSEVAVRTVPAVHGDRPMPHRPNDAVGFVVRWTDGGASGDRDGAGGGRGAAGGDGGGGAAGSGAVRRLWFAGDTELFPGLADLPDLAGGPIDVALVPVGGWGPRLSGGHLDPSRAAEAAAIVGARTAVPIHWGTFHAPLGRHVPRGWMDRGGPDFLRALDAIAPGTSGVLLAPGEHHAL